MGQVLRRVRVTPAYVARASPPSLATFHVPRDQADALYDALVGLPSMRLVDNNQSARAAALKAVVRTLPCHRMCCEISCHKESAARHSNPEPLA